MPKKSHKYDIFNLPPRLFKYYRYDSNLNAKRLAGEIYLASPYDFNDPCDCQRPIDNNSKEKVNQHGKDWLKRKLTELDYNETESEKIAESLLVENRYVKDIHRRMLERLGIFCLTGNNSDSLMWGYYANNDGICIEYDVTKIVRNLVIGYINKMSYTLTRHLYTNDNYCQPPKERSNSIDSIYLENSENIITSRDLKFLTNKFLVEQNKRSEILNFVRNVFLKRIYAQSIVYGISPKESNATLFFSRGNKTSEEKYFKKTKAWEHEQEFRFIVSLGGRLVVDLGKDCIKNIYLGCNLSNEKIIAIKYLMTKNNLKCGLYKMKRLKNGGLTPSLINLKLDTDYMELFEKFMKEKFPTE